MVFAPALNVPAKKLLGPSHTPCSHIDQRSICSKTTGRNLPGHASAKRFGMVDHGPASWPHSTAASLKPSVDVSQNLGYSPNGPSFDLVIHSVPEVTTWQPPVTLKRLHQIPYMHLLGSCDTASELFGMGLVGKHCFLPQGRVQSNRRPLAFWNCPPPCRQNLWSCPRPSCSSPQPWVPILAAVSLNGWLWKADGFVKSLSEVHVPKDPFSN